MPVIGSVQRRTLARSLPALALVAGAVAASPGASAATTSAPAAPAGASSTVLQGTVYRNPVSRSFADTYADPSVIRGKDGWYYAYGTSDPLRSGNNPRNYLPMSRSRDLVNWQYMGDAFTAATLPSWADRANDASLWAPEIHYANGQWRLYYVVTRTTVTPELDDSAIGVATAPSPLGPWTDSGAPVVGPRRGGEGNNFLWTFDPDVVTAPDGSQHLYYGSYYGGIWHADLNAAGTKTVGDDVRVAVDNKFEGAYVTRKNGYWYLFASTANCCAGPTTGYSVHVGRSKSLTGPFLDKEGVSLNASGYTGGTPVLYQNGNRWIGAGHNTLATDDVGQDWIIYHALDRNVPYLDGTDGINRRPMLIDRLDWRKGWPVVRFGCGPSETRQFGPIVKRRGGSGTTTSAAGRNLDCQLNLGTGRPVFTDEFNRKAPAKGWTALRSPAVTLGGGTLNWVTEKKDLVGTTNDAGVLLRNAPRGNWTVETKVTIDLGADELRNFQQAGLVAYVNDDLFTRLSTVAIWNTRQNEFGKEMPYAGRLSYGGTIVGPPAKTSWLRIVHRLDPANGEHELTPFTSRDGKTWTRGGTWTLPAGTTVKVGLVSQGAGGPASADAPPATASFDYFRISVP